MSVKKEKAQENEKVEVTVPAEAGKEDVMYLGPDVVGRIRHSTVFKKGVLPQRVKECVEEFPAMQKLFVPLHKVSEAVKELNKKKSVLAVIYLQVGQKFAKED